MFKNTLLTVTLVLLVVVGIGCRNKPPQIPVKPAGPTQVNLGDSAVYASVTTDPNRDRVLYIWDWADGRFDTTALMVSGDTVRATHRWDSIGTYPIRVRAKDDKGNFSIEWSDTLIVTVAIGVNQKPTVAAPIGPDSGWVGEWQVFKTVAVDPNGDSVKIKFLWDEGQTSLVSALVASGDTVVDSVKYFYRGIKNIRCVAWDKAGLMSDTSPAKVFNARQENTAPYTPVISGPSRGIPAGPYYRFYVRAVDPQGDRVRYKFFWGDGSSSEWTPLTISGALGIDSVRFLQPGTYYIKAVAQDSFGLVSETSAAKVFTVVEEGNVIWALRAEEFISSPALGQVTKGSELRPALIIGGTDNILHAYDLYQAETLYRASDITWDEFHSSPAVGSDGTVYIGNENGRFYAFTTNGTAKWAFPETLTQDPFATSAAIDGNTIYIAGEDGYLRKLQDNGTGYAELWNYYIGNDINASPVITPDGSVVVVDDSGYVNCLNSSGGLSWRYLLNTGVVSSPAVDGNGNVYVGTDQGDLIALSAQGALLWTYHVPTQYNDINSSPVIDQDGNVYFGCENGRLYKLNSNGQLAWEYDFGTGVSISSTPLLTADGVIYIAATVDTVTEKLWAINLDGNLRWELPLQASGVQRRGGQPRRLAIDLFPSPVVDQYGIVYIATPSGYVYAIAGRSGGYLMPSSWPMFRHDQRHTGKFGAQFR